MAKATLEWSYKEIPAQSFITLEIIWSPTVVWSTREVIQFTDNRNFKKDVPIILKSVDKSQKPKPILRKAVHGSENRMVTKKLTLKSPSRPKMQRSRLTVFNPSTVTNVRKQRHSINVDTSAHPNLTFDSIYTANKENVSPPSPKNISGVFDSLVFTPVSKSRNDPTHLDYLASLPTPGSNAKATPWRQVEYPRAEIQLSTSKFENRLDEIDSVIFTPYTVQNRTTVFENCPTPIDQTDANWSHFAQQQTPSISVDHTFNVSNVQTPSVEPTHSGGEHIQNHKFSLDVGHNQAHHLHQSPRIMETIAENSELSVNRTQTILSPMGAPYLSAIIEEQSRAELSETYIKPGAHHLTYNLEESTAAAADVAENLVRDVRLIGTPLKKKFQSLKELSDSRNNLSIEQMILKNNQGSMPNLHKMETVKSIENNRYFYQSVEKDLQQAANMNHVPDEDNEYLGDTSICSMKSTISIQSVAFQEHEILAQSSVFNLNEIGRGKSHATADSSIFGRRTKPVPHDTSDLNLSKHMSMSSPTISRTMAPPKSSQSTRNLSQANRKLTASAHNLRVPSTSTLSLNKRSHGDKSTDRHSPTKRACIDSNSPRLPNGQSIRTKTWGGKMPKKFRIPSIPSHRLQLKRPEEERVILFDPELHLRGKF